MSALNARMGNLHDRFRVDRGHHGDRPYAGHAAKGRLALLYLVSRRYAQSLVAIGVLTLVTWWTMRQTPTVPVEGLDLVLITARNETLLLHLAAALLASVISVAVWTPFGESERVSPVVLPAMRAVHLLTLLAAGCVALGVVIAGWLEVMPDVDLVPLFLRNAFFLTGLVLLAGRVVDVRLAWLVPVMFSGMTVVHLLQKVDRVSAPAELWRDNGWRILALDTSHGWANAICIGVGIAAVAVYVRDGVRDTVEEE